jgi:hypothetical protein
MENFIDNFTSSCSAINAANLRSEFKSIKSSSVGDASTRLFCSPSAILSTGPKPGQRYMYCGLRDLTSPTIYFWKIERTSLLT